MVRRVWDAMVLNLVAANGYHLAVVAARLLFARRARRYQRGF